MMAQLFDDVFNPERIHEMLFFNVKTVLIYQNLEELIEKNKSLSERWEYIAKTKYGNKYPDDTKAQTVYEQNAVYFPEFTKAVAITYATIYMENGVRKRYLKKIVNDDEYLVLATFMDELYQLSSNGVQSNPQYFPILCGHNIISHDIPFLIKKHILYRDKFDKKIPFILKRTLGIKPWESGVIDTLNVWKFNGFDNMPLMLIGDFLGLKKTTELLSLNEVSSNYWAMRNVDIEKALEFVSLQSATQTNMVLQLMNTLSQL